MAKEYLTETQYQIKRRQEIDNASTNQWLKNQGINSGIIEQTKTQLLQAIKVATNILQSEDKKYLIHDEYNRLNNFIKKTKTSNKNKITTTECYKIINLGYHLDRRKTKSVKSGSEV